MISRTDPMIPSRMLEDEALGFCYALQRYISQDENRYQSPMFPVGVPQPLLYVHTKIGAETVPGAEAQPAAALYVHTKIGAEKVVRIMEQGLSNFYPTRLPLIFIFSHIILCSEEYSSATL